MDDLPLFMHLSMDDSHFGYKQKFLRKQPFAPHHTGAFILIIIIIIIIIGLIFFLYEDF
jgi:hypothetical protein